MPDTAHVEEGIKIKPVNVGMHIWPFLPCVPNILWSATRTRGRWRSYCINDCWHSWLRWQHWQWVCVCDPHRPFLVITNLIVIRFQEIVGYLERQYDDILAEESRIKRNPRFRDNRVHALLYFIPPTGHAWVESFLARGYILRSACVVWEKWISNSCGAFLHASMSYLSSERQIHWPPVNLRVSRRGLVFT